MKDESQLFEENVALVVFLMKKLWPVPNEDLCGFDKDDVFQEGCIGLLKAIRTYKPEKGFTFSTYAGRCIMNNILMLYRKDVTKRYILTLDTTLSDDVENERELGKDFLRDPVDVESEVLANMLRDFYESEAYKQKFKKKNPCTEQRQREVLALTLQGYRQSEIARILGVSQRVAASYAATIRKHVREVWGYKKR